MRASAVDLGRLAAAILGDLDGERILMSSAAANRLFCPEGGSLDAACEGRVATGGSQYGDTYD
ncbi:MAG: hypothetical protein V3V08_11060 [Nannocystaceae bacterium]